MTQDILITPGSGEPQILFRGSGTNDTPIELNVLSSYQSATGSGTALVFEGQEGQLFAVTDNLSSGTIFSVGDITGLSMLSVDASGDVKLGEFANSVIVYPGLTLDDNVPSTTTNVLYNDGGDLMWNGVTVVESGATQAVDGSGTASYVARFTDTNTLGTGVIYDNGTNVGIGTASPSQTVDIRYPAGGGMALLKSTDTADGLLFGDMAYSFNNTYQGIKHAAMTGDQDYMILSEGTNTYISAKSGGITVIGAGGNDVNSQIRLTSTEVVVNDNSSNRDFRVESDNNANMLFVDGVTDRVAIGTSTNHVPFTVYGDCETSIANANGGSHNVQIIDNRTLAAGVGGAIGFGGKHSGSSNTIFAEIKGIKENGTDGNYASALTLHTRENGGNLTERLRITSAGSVGIGTTSPSSSFKLETAGKTRIRSSGYTLSSITSDLTIVGSTTSTDASVYPSISIVNRSNTTESLSVINLIASDGIVYGGLFADGVGTINGLGDAGIAVRTTSNHPIIFRTNNTEKMRIAAGGNVGIGTASPSQKLHIDEGNIRIEKTTDPTIEFNNGSTNRASMFYDTSEETFVLNHADADANQLVLTSGNNVGVGTNSPNSTFHVYSATSGENVFNVEGTNGSLFGVTDSLSGVLMSVNTIAGLPVLEVNSDYSVTAGRFNQNDFVITSSGDIGIGTDTPLSKFHVEGGIRTIDGIYFKQPSSTEYRRIYSNSINDLLLENLHLRAGYSVGVGGNRGTTLGMSYTSSDLGLYTASNERIRITSGGNVGIGETTPTQKLHVAGNLRLTGAFYDSNNAAGTSGQVLSSTATGTDWISLSEIQGVDGTGSAGQVAFWSDADTITGESNLYWDSANNRLGINTSSPSSPYSLHVNGYALIQTNTQPTLKIDAINTSSPSYTANIELNGFGGRGQGIFFKDKNYANEEWFMGMPYIGYFDKFQIGYDSAGGQSEYEANSFFTINSAGNVGIGTTTPRIKLNINGGKAGIVSTDSAYGQFRVGNTADNEASIGFFAGLTESTFGAGTPTATHKWAIGLDVYGIGTNKFGVGNVSDATSVFTIQEGGNVGIGTTSPSSKLHIVQNTASNVLLRLEQDNASYESYYEATSQDGGYSRFGIGSNANDYTFFNSDQSSYRWYTSSTPLMTLLTSNGNLGIGTTSPINNLQIGTTTATATSSPVTLSLGGTYSSTAGANPKFKLYQDASNNNYGFGVSSNSLDYITPVSTNSHNFYVGGSHSVRITQTSLGIGTTNPQQELHVVGDQRIENATDPKLEFHDGAAVGGYVKFDTSEDNLVLSHVDVAGDNQIALANDGNVGIGTASPNAVLHAYGSTPSGTVFNVEGTNGSLFSVVDNLSGVLMSVNNNAGLPVFEVNDDDSIVGGRFAQNDFVVTTSGDIGMGTANPSSKLEVNGTVTATCASLGQLNVDNLRLDGNTLSSTNTNGNINITPNGNGGIAAGVGATVTGSYAVVGGGKDNTASNNFSTVGGGQYNTASGYGSTVAGGGGYYDDIINVCLGNSASGYGSTVGGGAKNNASGCYSTVSGGYDNCACATNSSISGGKQNFVNARHGSINGGHYNVIQSPTNECCSRGATIGGGIGHNTSGGTVNGTTGDITGVVTCCNAGAFSTISGGYRNHASIYATVGGGGINSAPAGYSTVGGGYGNTASGACSTVSGGAGNTAGMFSTVGGGECNTASGYYGYSTVGGGLCNTASGYYGSSTVSGGYFNTAGESYSTVGGGNRNTACGTNSSISGGCRNLVNARHGSINGGHYNVIQSPTNECCSRGATIGGGIGHNTTGGTFNGTTGDITGTVTCCNAGPYSTISGGLKNLAGCEGATVGGGKFHTAIGLNSTISGGCKNCATEYASTVGGGRNNHAIGCYSTVSGGGGSFFGNCACGDYSTVSGGRQNIACGGCSTVSGGYSNTVSGSYSSIAGGKSNNDNGCCNVHILGSNITATAADTTYTENLHVTCALKINKFDHTNLSVASSFADTDVLVAVIDPTGTASTESLQGSVLRSSLLNQPAQLQFRQGTDAERQAITPASGEPIWTTDNKEIWIGDGTTCGGLRMGPSMHKAGTCPGSINTISGGNTTSDCYSTVSGGRYNTASGPYSTVSGGAYNTASGNYSTVGGGGGSIFGGYIPQPNTASGPYSTVSGGRNNTASGDCSTVGGGHNNCASGSDSTVGGGTGNVAECLYTTVSGGGSNKATSLGSVISGGFSNCATADYSTVSGGYSSKATRYGEVAHSAGRFSFWPGEAQHSTFVARKNTTDATANVELFLNGSSERMTITAETTWTFDIKLSAYNDTDNTAAWWIFRGGIRRNAANGTTLIGSIIEERDYEGTMSGTSAAVTADDTNESLKIAVTGLASKNIRWVAVVDVAQVSWGTP